MLPPCGALLTWRGIHLPDRGGLAESVTNTKAPRSPHPTCSSQLPRWMPSSALISRPLGTSPTGCSSHRGPRGTLPAGPEIHPFQPPQQGHPVKMGLAERRDNRDEQRSRARPGRGTPFLPPWSLRAPSKHRLTEMRALLCPRHVHRHTHSHVHACVCVPAVVPIAVCLTSGSPTGTYRLPPQGCLCSVLSRQYPGHWARLAGAHAQ